jgi:hypothetical protein
VRNFDGLPFTPPPPLVAFSGPSVFIMKWTGRIASPTLSQQETEPGEGDSMADGKELKLAA